MVGHLVGAIPHSRGACDAVSRSGRLATGLPGTMLGGAATRAGTLAPGTLAGCYRWGVCRSSGKRHARAGERVLQSSVSVLQGTVE